MRGETLYLTSVFLMAQTKKEREASNSTYIKLAYTIWQDEACYKQHSLKGMYMYTWLFPQPVL